MKNKEKIAAIKEWQNCPYVHPLTCGNNSLHENLVPIEIKGKIVLICPECDYQQTHIPDIDWSYVTIQRELMDKIANNPQEFYNEYMGNFVPPEEE